MEIANYIDSSYGKPCQGTTIQYNLETKIYTPLWNGNTY